MYRVKSPGFLPAVLLALVVNTCFASGSGDTAQYKDIKKTAIDSEKDRQRLEETAVLLARYEIEAKKLLNMLDASGEKNAGITRQADKLMLLSEEVIASARFRLPQCDAYLAKSLALKSELASIRRDRLEADYHLDAALPDAPPECYHTKDLFVHPATVIVLTRDDPAMNAATRSSIRAEIKEVLTHTDVVRQLVVY